MEDRDYMNLTLNLAKKPSGRIAPGPYMAALIVKDGRVIGKGRTEDCGAVHAIRQAIDSCREEPTGAVLYTNLEPCAHDGRTLPCTDAIIEAGIRRVVIATLDPHPEVNGDGVRILRENGIDVEVGLMRSEADYLNEVYLHFIKYTTPFVILKYAVMSDGKIESTAALSKRVTGSEIRNHIHRQRDRYTALMVEADTILQEDPMLICQLEDGHNPYRIICDARLRVPLNANVVKTAEKYPTIIATGSYDITAQQAYKHAGCHMYRIREALPGIIDLPALMHALAAIDIDSILLGGGTLLSKCALKARIVNKVEAYLAHELVRPGRCPERVAKELFAGISC